MSSRVWFGNKLTLQTKATPKKSAGEFIKGFKESLKALRVDYVDLFAIHGINDETLLSYTLKKGGCPRRGTQIKGRRHGPPYRLFKPRLNGCHIRSDPVGWV